MLDVYCSQIWLCVKFLILQIWWVDCLSLEYWSKMGINFKITCYFEVYAHHRALHHTWSVHPMSNSLVISQAKIRAKTQFEPFDIKLCIWPFFKKELKCSRIKSFKCIIIFLIFFLQISGIMLKLEIETIIAGIYV